MCYAFSMQIVKCLHDLLEEPSTNTLLHLSIGALLLHVLV